jgi:hypothetical protein
MNWKNVAIYTVVVATVSAAVTRYYWPQVETQIKIEEKEVIKRDVRTIIKEITKPDGTKETETEIIDNTTESRKKELESLKLKKKDWFIAGGATVNINDVNPVYNVQVNRRILGSFYLGASVNTRKDVGVQIGFEF